MLSRSTSKTKHLEKGKTNMTQYIENLGSNKTALYCNGNKIYFSYDTPVVVCDYDNEQVVITTKKYSSTTSKHINSFVDTINRWEKDGWKHKDVEQEEINDYLEEDKVF